MHFDVFNGDADGICALHQLRLANPIDSVLVTGVKRDIDLVKRVPEDAGSVTVLDISLEKNVTALQALLDNDIPVQYFDHHFPGDIPDSPHLDCHINTEATVCTGLLVNAHLQGAHLPWAVTAAYGDNLNDAARAAAEPLNLEDDELNSLQELGTLMNYNGYGASLSDLYFAPDALYDAVRGHESPFGFIADEPAFKTLQAGFADD
ncbi:MAG: acetyltransferase, partial [Pseudomonadota bacterium]